MIAPASSSPSFPGRTPSCGQPVRGLAAGIDLGGTKSEIRLFDQRWNTTHARRDPTPLTYDALLALLADQIEWARQAAGGEIAIGLGTAGLFGPDGTLQAVNLPANGVPLQRDLEDRVGQPVACLNDAHAFVLSEARFGAGRGASRVMGLVLGTGVGGGLVVDGTLAEPRSGLGGEYGHAAAPASVLQEVGLPLETCGCGRTACYEAYLSGPGLARLASRRLGRNVTTKELARLGRGDPAAAEIWDIWCRLAAELILTMTFMADPDCIVVGGGLSEVPGLIRDLRKSTEDIKLGTARMPDIHAPEQGATSGSLGAAFAAWDRHKHIARS